jgi:hypothetical protein
MIRIEDQGRVILTAPGVPVNSAMVIFEEAPGRWAMKCGRDGGIVRSDGRRETLEEIARIALTELLPEVRAMLRSKGL